MREPSQTHLSTSKISFARAGLEAPCGILGPDGFNKGREVTPPRARPLSKSVTLEEKTMLLNHTDPIGHFARQHAAPLRMKTQVRLRSGGCHPHQQSPGSEHRFACAVYHAARAFNDFALDENPHLQVNFRDGADGKLHCTIIDPTLPQCPDV